MWRFLLYPVQLILLFLVYFAAARLGLSFDAVSGFATLIWLPSGISLAAVLIFGYSIWPAITIAAYLANLIQGASYPVALGIGVGNTLEALVGGYLLKRYGFKISLERLKDVGLLFIAIPLSACISATIGVTSLLLGGGIVLLSAFPTWITWWVGDMISMLIVTPLLLTWRLFRQRELLQRNAETAVTAIITLGISIIVFIFTKSSLLTYLIFPPLIWIALRYTQREAVTATFVLLAVAIWGRIQGLGPFAAGELSSSLLQLQGFIGVLAATSLIVSSISAERRELGKRKDEIISIVSHELKTPITSMQLYINILKKMRGRSKDTKQLSYLEKMDWQIKRLASLINDLLDVSKIQADKIEFHKERFSVRDLVHETVSNIQDTTSNHEIIVRSPGKDTLVYSDRQRISQVLTNLLTNAIKYSPSGKRVIINITTREDKAMISIRDFGLGIGRKDINKIFQRYYRANESIPGFGIGLYISSEIIKHLGGEMWVESKKGKGSTFSFSIPLQGE